MLILKSASLRRKQIFENLKLHFSVEPSHVSEDTVEGESPLNYLKRVTTAKLEISKAEPGNMYIASDTIVVCENRILAKPTDRLDGYEILSFLSGKEHSVYSGLGIWKNGQISYDFDETKVQFKTLSENDIYYYLDSQKPYDKAGAYGIQDEGSPVLNFTGSYTNVMGFPIRKFYQYFLLWREYLS